MGSPGGAVVNNLTTNAGDARDVGSIAGLGRFPGVRYGKLLQYSCVENSMDREAERARVHGVSKNRTWLNMYVCTHTINYSHYAVCYSPRTYLFKDWKLVAFGCLHQCCPYITSHQPVLCIYEFRGFSVLDFTNRWWNKFYLFILKQILYFKTRQKIKH